MNDFLWLLIGAAIGAFGLGAWLSATATGGGYQPRRRPGSPPPRPPKGGTGTRPKKSSRRYQRPRDL